MKSPLRILHLEDDSNDAALVLSTLTKAGISCETRRVQDHDDFVEALKEGDIDLIFSDFSLPTFDGFSALEIAHDIQPDVPVIFVSGTLGENMAVDSLKHGATDYVLKESLIRLPPAVRRAMKEVEDRVEHRRLETQFVEGQKMEIIGQLAGGVAHDFNNILAVIMGYSDLIAADLGPDNPLQEYTQEIRLASARAAGLTRQLLIFSRKETVQAVELNINDILMEMDQMLRRLIDANIEMTFVPGEEIGCILADPGYIGQVVMNLSVNARDAMPSGGKLMIATSNIRLDDNSAHCRAGAPLGDYVMLSVTDTGTGMTDEVKTHLFEAFFTTKAHGKGTGLGLTTCQTIVKHSGGLIDVSSEIGKGTTFKIYFPTIERSSCAAITPAAPESQPCGTETLLIVEDDQSVRKLACSVLEAHGYHVKSASNGRDALKAVHQHKGPPIRLVITDVIMPLMDGKVMADWLKASFPDIKVLFTSGYTDDAIAHHGVLESGVEFLHKPYAPGTLVRKVREILDRPTL
jgi:two-component system cell cycle sensor histidine kinase/response regulator CckA